MPFATDNLERAVWLLARSEASAGRMPEQMVLAEKSGLCRVQRRSPAKAIMGPLPPGS